MHITISLASNVTNELVAGWCITERVKRLAGNEVELGMKILAIESRASIILMTKGITYVVITVRPIKIFVEYVEPIWASRFRYWLLTGDVSRSCLHCSRTRRIRTLKVTMTVSLWVYIFLCTEGCSESRMWSRTWWGISKWSRHEDWYIGSLYLDIGSVPSEIGILPEYRGVTETPRGLNGP